MSTDAARRFPVRTALSGPAAGVIAARAIGLAAGYPDIVTADLGGTSFDVSLVAGGEAALAAQTTIDFGLVVRTPMIEITTIGAGGGSIAHVDAGGLLAVGPESAGSRPGPVCYGQGNDRPTLTDANLVLGRINAARPIGGKLASLDREAAAAALLAHVGRPLGLSAEDAAEAVVRVANAKMAGAIRLVSIERGHDPTRFTALPFGGGGALHVGALIREVGLKAALVPRYPGVTSALGCIIADIRHDQVLTLNLTLDGLDAAALSARLAREGEAARGIVAAAGLDMEEIEVRFALDMHYVGQTHTVTALLPPPCGEGGEHGEPGGVRATLAAEASATPSRPSAALRATLPARGREDILTSCATEAIVRAAFEKAYSAAFSRLLPGVPARIVNLRTTAIGRRPAFDLKALAPGLEASLDAARDGTRPVWFDGGWREATIWRRLLLPVGAVIAGPAILEQGDATTVIDPGLVARVDAFGNLIVERV
jgi:N-methylhydantoinase A